MSPSPFVVEWLQTLGHERSGGRALDLAMGRGRHASAIAEAGFRVFGVDQNLDALRRAAATAAARGRRIRAWCADLTRGSLPVSTFDVIVVTRYLQRDLFPSLVEALVPSGVLVYETFTIGQLAHGTGPTSPDHLLEPGELKRALQALEAMFYEEVSAPEAVARFVGRRASSPS
jgi:tellurite methyltransferase